MRLHAFSWTSFSRFARNRAGGVALVFSLGAPVVAIAIGAAVDYSRYTAAATSLRHVADGAALAGAQNLRLASATTTAATQVVNAYVGAQTANAVAPIVITPGYPNGLSVVSVQLDQDVPTVVSKLAGVTKMHVSVTSKAKIVGGGMPYCMIALDPSASGATSVTQATLTATGCQIYADSAATDSLSTSNSATISAGPICSHGGAKNDGTASLTPAPQTDCPLLNDPLATRVQPTVGSCTYNNLKITHGSQTLLPGVYCGGLEISGSANVTLSSGVYAITNGPLTLKANSTIAGTDVTIFLSGSGATLSIANKSNVSLTAPSTGATAGMLIWEDRASPVGQTHKFESRNAPVMLGTVYMPQGTLQIGVQGGGGGSGVGVGASSAWTIMVARQISITDQQTLVLNTNYSSTTVPPPAGLGPVSGVPQLVN